MSIKILSYPADTAVMIKYLDLSAKMKYHIKNNVRCFMEIRLTTIEDLDEVMEIYKS